MTTILDTGQKHIGNDTYVDNTVNVSTRPVAIMVEEVDLKIVQLMVRIEVVIIRYNPTIFEPKNCAPSAPRVVITGIGIVTT